MTGKEALEELMETFYELCEDCNCNEDEYQKNNLTSPYHIIRKELEQLTKYKRAFEILKEKGIFEFKDYNNRISLNPNEYDWNGDLIEDMFINVNDEEYELLEELMGNE